MTDKNKDLYKLGLYLLANTLAVAIPIAVFIFIISIGIALGDAIRILVLQ